MRLVFLVAMLAIATQGVAPSVQVSSIQQTNDAVVKQWRARIAGREKEPAERVFKNIQKMGSIPAATFLVIMNRGYSRGLGVSCTHCHDDNDFASDDKRPKRAAREMMDMHRAINDRLKELTNLQTPPADRAINCSTCHRGSVDPVASDMKQREAAPATPVQASNDAMQKQWMEKIAGHEKDPAATVFKNVQWLKDVSAATFLSIMNGGYARALGVTCTHCHVESDFSSDDKPPKRAAREMAAMHRMINDRLKAMQHLQPSPNHAMNCSTCHRGVVDPLSTDK